MNTTLLPGFYVGIRRATRNFSFSLPNQGKGVTDSDMDRWFMTLNSGTRTVSSAPASNLGVEKSTSFSGWYKTDNAINLSNKCIAAPEIYKAAGGGDPNLAKDRVSQFKKKAAEVLSRCADSGEAITETTAAEINRCACIVHEIKVVVLCVKDTEFPGARHDGNTNRWYFEKTVRKFFLTEGPLDSLLQAFAAEIADETTEVNAERKLVAVRNDRVTPRTGRAAQTSSFAIRQVSNDEAMATDALLLAAVNRIKQKQLQR